MHIINLVFPLFITVSAIRVPTVWPEENTKLKHKNPIEYGSYYRKNSFTNREDLRLYPHRSSSHNKPLHFSKLPYKIRRLHQKPKKYIKKFKPEENSWTPINPYSYTRKSSPPKQYTNRRKLPRGRYVSASSEFVTSRSSPINKNYRDDETYEVDDNRHDVEEQISKKTENEYPPDNASPPIYPGEGYWAKPIKKQKILISKPNYSQESEDTTDNPEGYEIFLRGKSLYDNKHKKFEKNENVKNEKDDDYNDDDTKQAESDEDDFVPSTMYVQVRRSENEEHLPKNAEGSEDGRLKEVIKDSKILTVYTEEGYEDSAYDHAGHEKEAEDSQGYNEFKKEEEKDSQPKHKEGPDDLSNEGSIMFPSIVNNPNTKKSKTPTIQNNNLHKTESTKIVKLKDEPDGIRMEITSEMKTFNNPDSNKNDNLLPNNETSTIQISRNESETKDSIKNSYIGKLGKNRRKRFANDFPTIDVKTDFIDSAIQEDPRKFENHEEGEKYPYYKSKYIDHNSPLKYSENMDNIPEKTEGRMTFYEQANKIQCPEVDDDIAAIPKGISSVEKSINNEEKLEDNENSGKSPKLGQLGKRIDCFKRKYFGENPLDSPFFKEKMVEAVTLPFKVFQERSAGFQANHVISKGSASNYPKRKYHSKFSMRSRSPSSTQMEQSSPHNPDELESQEIINNINETNEDTNYFDQSHNNIKFNPEVEVINVETFKSINGFNSEKPPVNLITTPKYAVNITPKHIYDQIRLVNSIPSPEFLNEETVTENPRTGKTVDATESSPLKMQPSYRNYGRRKPQRIKKPQFDVTSFIQDTSRRVTLTPNSYGNENNKPHEQTPLDQMNVFADVINNIRNGSNDPLRVDASTQNYLSNNIIRMRVPPKKIHIRVPDSVKYSNERKVYYRTSTFPSTISASTKKSKRGSIRYATTEKEIYYDDYLDNEEKITNHKIHSIVETSTTSRPEETDFVDEETDSEVSGSHTTETIYKGPVQKTADIVGLVPPSKYHYRTIYQPVEELLTEPIVSESEIINNYHVLGMKPPSKKQKVFDYSDFHKIFTSKNSNNHKYVSHKRGKRSPNRKSYFEVVGGQITNDKLKQEKEDDDYVPHRPKNWHWDETLRKIVYDKPKETPTNSADENDEEVIEVEVEESTPANIQKTTTRRSFTTTTPLNGPSYVDFVQILKKKKGYVSIPDPTTTKDGITMEITTSSPVTIKTEPTKQPEFLSFVSKLKKSDSYVLFEEKNKTKAVTTSTEPPESEEDTDIHSSLSNIQNSPGRGAVDIGQNLKIFNVNDFLPKVKTYSPRTEIDYSKYKTIQRPRIQTTTEASKNEDQNISFKLEKEEEQLPESSSEGKLEIFELSRPSTTSTSTTTIASTTTIQKKRRRRPTTTQRSIITSTNSKDNTSAGTYSKPKRVYPRRRPTHIRTRTTTQKSKEDLSAEQSKKIVIRRHNLAKRPPKVVSLEALIEMEKPKDQQEPLTTNKFSENYKNSTVTIDDVLKNINRLKEVSVEESLPDYALEIKSDEADEVKDEDFDDEDTKVNLDNSGITNRKLVISKDKQQGMFYYTSVR